MSTTKEKKPKAAATPAKARPAEAKPEAKPEAQGTTTVLPLCLGPLVTLELCDRRRIAHGCQKKRNSVMDFLDGREWVVRWEGDVLVAEKTGANSFDQQAQGQYERLRQVLATASHRAKAYSEAFENQKANDTAELTEASRAEVERILAEEQAAKENFERFESEHPQCLRKRLSGEAHYHRTQAAKHRLDAEKYEKAVLEWQSKIDDVAQRTGRAGEDDHMEEQKSSCQATADAARAKQEAEEDTVRALERQVASLPEFQAVTERFEVRPGETVAFG